MNKVRTFTQDVYHALISNIEKTEPFDFSIENEMFSTFQTIDGGGWQTIKRAMYDIEELCGNTVYELENIFTNIYQNEIEYESNFQKILDEIHAYKKVATILKDAITISNIETNLNINELHTSLATYKPILSNTIDWHSIINKEASQISESEYNALINYMITSKDIEAIDYILTKCFTSTNDHHQVGDKLYVDTNNYDTVLPFVPNNKYYYMHLLLQKKEAEFLTNGSSDLQSLQQILSVYNEVNTKLSQSEDGCLLLTKNTHFSNNDSNNYYALKLEFDINDLFEFKYTDSIDSYYQTLLDEHDEEKNIDRILTNDTISFTYQLGKTSLTTLSAHHLAHTTYTTNVEKPLVEGDAAEAFGYTNGLAIFNNHALPNTPTNAFIGYTNDKAFGIILDQVSKVGAGSIVFKNIIEYNKAMNKAKADYNKAVDTSMIVSDNTKIQHIARDINLAYSRTMTSQNGTFYDSNQWHATSATMEKLENLQYNVENNPQLMRIIAEINRDPSCGLTITANDFEFNTVIQDIERYDYLVDIILNHPQNEVEIPFTKESIHKIMQE